MTQASAKPLPSGQRLVLALLWLAVIAVAGWAIGQRLQLSGDLRKFMPAPHATAATEELPAARAADASEVATL